MNGTPQKKIKIRAKPPADYRKYIAEIRGTAAAELELQAPAPETVSDQGIYIGQWEAGGLGKTFNVFAAPQDLTDSDGNKTVLDFNETCMHVAELSGHGTWTRDADFYHALKNDAYKGEWFIPTHDILKNNLYAHKDVGALKDTFCTATGNSPKYPSCYWSCTERRDGGQTILVGGVNFVDGGEASFDRKFHSLSCRLVRLVEVPRP